MSTSIGGYGKCVAAGFVVSILVFLMGSVEIADAAKSPRDVYNCGDFKYRDDAQAILDEDPRDPNRLDGDKDGIACESLPRRGAPLPNPAGDVPLIFVPGITGSELRDLEGNEKWPRADEVYQDTAGDRFLLDIGLNEDGSEIVETEPGEILRYLAVNNAPDPDIYATTIDRLTDAGYVEDVDLFVFPFDWRKDVEGQGKNELIAKINQILNETGASRVDIMAHSQGGLVTLAALRDTDSIGKIRRVITMGTPLLGSAKTLGLLEYRLGCFGSGEVLSADCYIDSETAQQMIKYMPGANQLLPSRKYDEAVGAPLVVDLDSSDDGEKFYDEWVREVTVGPHVSEALLVQAGEFHRRYDVMAWADPSVEMLRIVGTGRATPTAILRYNDCDFMFFSCEVAHKYSNEGTGDTTVAVGSAVPGNIYDPIGRAETLYVGAVEHGELPKNSYVMEQAIGFLRPAAASRPFSASGDEEVRFSSAPQPFDGIHLEATGSIRGYVSDDTGNVSGSLPGDDAESLNTELRGASYNATSNHQSFFLNEDGSYTWNFVATGKGSVQLEVMTYARNEVEKEVVFRIAPPAGAKLRLAFATGEDPERLELQVDRDGNGTVDREALSDSTVAGPSAGETDPPNTIATFDTLPDGQANVTLSADDGSDGSGVADTYYMLEGDAKSRLYNGSFNVPSGAVVKFLSVDKAGNAERIKTFAPGTN